MPRIVPLLLMVMAPSLSGCIYWGRGMYVFLPEYEDPPGASWMNQLLPNPPKPQLVWKGHYYSFVEEERKANEELKARAPLQNPLRVRRQKSQTDDSPDE